MHILQANREFAHGLMSGMGNFEDMFPDTKLIKKSPKTVLCKELTYVQKDINKSDNNFVS